MATPARAALSLRGIGHVFAAGGQDKPVRALQGIDLDIGEGEFFSVIGPSGCGKSTLMDIITGLIAPSEGDVRFEGTLVRGAVPDGIGVVFQEDASFPWLSVRDNIAFGLRDHGLRDSRDRAPR